MVNRKHVGAIKKLTGPAGLVILFLGLVSSGQACPRPTVDVGSTVLCVEAQTQIILDYTQLAEGYSITAGPSLSEEPEIDPSSGAEVSGLVITWTAPGVYDVVIKAELDYQGPGYETGTMTTQKNYQFTVIKVEFVHLSAAPQGGIPETRFENDIASGPIAIQGLVKVTPEDQVDKVSLKLAHNVKTLRQTTRSGFTTNMFQISTGGAWVKDDDSTMNTRIQNPGVILINGTDEPAELYWTDGPFSHPLHVAENHKNFLQYRLLSCDWQTLGVVGWGWTADVYKNGETITTSGTIEGDMGHESNENPITSPHIRDILETRIPPID